jgi:uncharacterized protein
MPNDASEQFSDFDELLPEINEFNAPYWDGLSAGDVRLQHCNGCGANQYPAESFCYECGATDLEWRTVAGDGEVYSFIIVHQAYHPAFKQFLPYTVAIVQMDDGPRMLAAMPNLSAPVAIGDRVKPRIQAVNNERSVLMYEPAA